MSFYQQEILFFIRIKSALVLGSVLKIKGFKQKPKLHRLGTLSQGLSVFGRFFEGKIWSIWVESGQAQEEVSQSNNVIL
jgi:hypothetical protein